MLQNLRKIAHCVHYGMAVTHWGTIFPTHSTYLTSVGVEGHFFGNTIYTQTKRNANLVESDRVQTG